MTRGLLQVCLEWGGKSGKNMDTSESDRNKIPTFLRSNIYCLFFFFFNVETRPEFPQSLDWENKDFLAL